MSNAITSAPAVNASRNTNGYRFRITFRDGSILTTAPIACIAGGEEEADRICKLLVADPTVERAEVLKPVRYRSLGDAMRNAPEDFHEPVFPCWRCKDEACFCEDCDRELDAMARYYGQE